MKGMPNTVSAAEWLISILKRLSGSYNMGMASLIPSQSSKCSQVKFTKLPSELIMPSKPEATNFAIFISP